ncbi:hypothetical protein F5Y01DRAFT_280702 [Xylaria sp. FL0043]|nr:hypothetical protein F5Y01DRAFT_280702 [Xylaria sp. FL0043]
MAAQGPESSASALASVSASFLGRPETPTRISAPYGQACVNCAKAKCKCIILRHPGSGSGTGSGLDSRPTCERCARLGRECRPSSGVRKRGAAGSRRAVGGSASAGVTSGTSAATRAANLEQKLEDLVAILKAQTSATPPIDAPSQPDANESHRQGNVGQNARREPGLVTLSASDWRSNSVLSRILLGGATVITPASTGGATGSTANSTPSPLPAPAHDVPIPAPQAEETLAFFTRHHLKFFPFVYLPPETTAAQLQRDRPYLWRNIEAICSKSPIRQADISRRSREEIAHRLLVACERNIDLLLGTLCFLGWTMHLCFKPGLAATMSLATSLVADLRLDKPIHEGDPRMMNCFRSPDHVKRLHSTVRTMEERRATLACYVFCASGSSFLRCASMRWTSHMEDSLKILAANPEWEGDKILVVMVRVMKLAESVFQAQTTLVSDCDNHDISKPPVNIYIKYFQQCLETIKSELPESLKDNRLATSLIMYAEMLITELPFSNWNYPPESGAPSRSRPIDLARVEASFVSLQTSKAFLEHFLTFEVPDFVGFSFPVLLNFFRAAHILYRLRVMDDPAWDRSAVTRSIDLLAALGLVANRFNQLPGLYSFLTETDAEGNEVTNFYIKCARTFSGTLPMWRAHFAQADGQTDVSKLSCADNTLRADAGSSRETVSQVPPAMMGAGLTSAPGVRMNYQGGSNSWTMPEVFPMDFSMDDVWSYELMGGYSENLFGLQYSI